LAERDRRLAALARPPARLRQPGLFDRRAARALDVRPLPRRWLPSTSLRAGKPAPTTVSEAPTVAGHEPIPDGAVPEDDCDCSTADRAPSIAFLLFITADGGNG
jgi:hypothetical protein